ncbi:nitroreductase [Clostridium sp. CAG:354]|jgi:nitroreductase|uniref:nitroreductase n=1 Tax=Candidatus Merdicola sp. TaxID=3085652 RepID=UPI0003391489|nr:nitroreductase [Clostridium sp.]MEE0269187.1 nitroreductase [Clostridia bacterium]OKZ60414.1 MAG: diguanylate cyclase [Clostridium sp. CAG:354_28_25]CDE10067.1 nitroreductase [Clostridium sp. CAG:354]
MNETIKNLVERRSCRKYSSTQIKEDELNSVLKAGEYAPTGMGMQSPIIVVLQNKSIIDKLSKINAKIMGKDEDPFYGAPTVLVVLADKNIGTYIEDGSLVLGNLMNAAYSLGLGSCWIHRAKEEFETDEGKELLKEWNISENYVGIGHCILGYPEEKSEAKPRKDGYIRFVK